MPPIVSVNLCCHNSEAFLEETLASIFAQTYSNWELVIINDGSTDGTDAIIQKHMAQGRPIVYHPQANAGLGRSRNKAIELSRGDFVAIIDHDDLWRPQKLEKQIALFQNRPRVGLVYSDAYRLYPGGEAEGFAPNLSRHRGQVLNYLLLYNFVVCSTIVVRRTALDQVGWFNPDFVQAEEYDLMIRLAEQYEFDYVDEPLATYRIHARNASRNAQRMNAEICILYQTALERNPGIREEFGRLITQIKLAGLVVTLGESYLLQGRWNEAGRWHGSTLGFLGGLLRVVTKVCFSVLPPAIRIPLYRARYGFLRLLALRHG